MENEVFVGRITGVQVGCGKDGSDVVDWAECRREWFKV